jgi:hypothetical protein
MATKATSSKKAAEKKPAAKKSAMTKAAVTKAPEKKPAIEKAAEKKPAEKKPIDKKAPGKTVDKIAEKKPAIEKVADKKPAPITPAPIKPAPVKPAEIAPDAAEVKASQIGDITIEDAKRILAEVRAHRSVPKGVCRAALPLTFVNVRTPKSAAELGPIERRQLVAAGADGKGEARTPEGWLDAGGESKLGSLEVWDVVDTHGIPVYALWMYLGDNGTVFRAGTIEVIGGISKSGLQSEEEGLEEALLDAQARLDKGLLKRSLLRFMG